MAVRGTRLGGTDFTFGESPVASADFNDTLNNVGVRVINNTITTLATNKNYVEDVFSSDTAVTSTNLTYDATEDVYHGKGSAAIVLETASHSLDYFDSSFNTVQYVFVDFDYKVFTVIDEIDDSSIDTNLWTTAVTNTVASENTDVLSVTGTGIDTSTRVADLLSDTDHKGTDDTIVFRGQAYLQFLPGGSAVGTTYTAKISLYDTSNEVILEGSTGTLTTDLSLSYYGTYVLKFDNSAETVRVFKADATWLGWTEISGSPFDLSSLTAWRIRFYSSTASTGGGAISRTSTAQCWWLRKQTGSETTSVTFSGSSDAGGNYTACGTDSQEANITTTSERGVQMRGKLTTTVAAGEVIVINRAIYGGRVIPQ